MRTAPSSLVTQIRGAYVWIEDKPTVIVIAAAGATVGAIFVLASAAGWTRIMRLTESNHHWAWLLVCMVGELVAYGGYMLTIQAMARVDGCADMSLSVSAKTVVAGLGVFAATRSSGGFAVDNWAFQKAGATESEAAARAVGLGLLEYVVLSIGALFASFALFFRLDGHASDSTTLPSLLILPCLGLGLFLTSPTRARRLSKPRGGFLRRWFAALIAGGVAARRLLLSRRVVIYRLFNFWLPIIPTLVLLPSIKQLRRRFRRAEQVA